MGEKRNIVKKKGQITDKIRRMIMMLPLLVLLLLVIPIGLMMSVINSFFPISNIIIKAVIYVCAFIAIFLFSKIVYYCFDKITNITQIISDNITIEKYKLLVQANKELQEKYINAKLKSKPLKHSFLVSLLTTIIGGVGFLGCVWLYWKFQNTFIIEPKFYNIKNDFCKLALIVFSRVPIIVFFIVGLLICKRCFTWYDKYRDYLSLWEYHSKINDKDKQDDLLIALAPNYFGTKRNRRSDNNFMEKLLLKMIPTLNINAGGGSNNGNNGGQNGGQTT